MDVRVYKKEEVRQPKGTEYVLIPNVIDIYPEIVVQEDGTETIVNAEILTEENEQIEQACSLATIWQKGLDPLDVNNGIRWSETLLGEINAVQLMEDLTNAVAEVTPTVTIVFDTITDKYGNSFLKYTLKAVV